MDKKAATTVKFRFRIRTRQGLVVEKLVIQAHSEAEAERKLRQMYPRCEVLESSSSTRGPAIPRMLALRGEPSIIPGK